MLKVSIFLLALAGINSLSISKPSESTEYESSYLDLPDCTELPKHSRKCSRGDYVYISGRVPSCNAAALCAAHNLYLADVNYGTLRNATEAINRCGGSMDQTWINTYLWPQNFFDDLPCLNIDMGEYPSTDISFNPLSYVNITVP